MNGVPHEVVGVMPPEFEVRMLEQARGFELWTLLAVTAATAFSAAARATRVNPVEVLRAE